VKLHDAMADLCVVLALSLGKSKKK
jgi:hypothetical protein